MPSASLSVMDIAYVGFNRNQLAQSSTAACSSRCRSAGHSSKTTSVVSLGCSKFPSRGSHTVTLASGAKIATQEGTSLSVHTESAFSQDRVQTVIPATRSDLWLTFPTSGCVPPRKSWQEQPGWRHRAPFLPSSIPPTCPLWVTLLVTYPVWGCLQGLKCHFRRACWFVVGMRRQQSSWARYKGLVGASWWLPANQGPFSIIHRDPNPLTELQL